ncbi:MAG TPA: hypothetical protein PLL58_04355 [Candidatus Syntrophosphaera sp.]|jgi:hypothetical protein|nr:hypothetical protein [Candidatus Cloacimonadota bacterium]OQB92490.1 MAG: hypothetical protein BWX83_00107 [Candidatus Cloacimonetes bacterium ADurb.Bin117]HNU53716.1 hypothetical protein [Candidatus Syntrophosphaera sp.]MDI9524370.1 hypothetical protein [Candidatus Cloacimonadota bacterium]NLH92799.1 hypothetical protein [Candidatus Cloacimonadota bacterium]
MIKRVLHFIPNLLLLLALSSCLVHTSLVYFDKDTEGVPNLVSNPGFSAYSLDPRQALLGWSVDMQGDSDAPKNLVFIDGKEAIQGNSSLRVDASPYTVVITSDAFRVSRYGGYYTRLWAKSSTALGPQINLRFITFKSNGKIDRQFRTKLKSTDTWEKKSISAGFLRPGVAFGRLQITIPPFTEGSVWLDDSGCWEVHRFRID